MDWQGEFDPRIIDRGLTYYESGQVKDFKKVNNHISATVIGSDYYSVSIDMDGDSIINADCDCPYAMDGNNCKHMVAVLFYFEEKSSDIIDDDLSIKDLVNNASEEQLKNFLIQVLGNNKRILNMFKNELSDDNDDELILYRDMVDEICLRNMDESDYIDYYRASRFENELSSLIYNNIETLIKNNRLILAFDVTKYIALKISFLDIDDSDGEIMILVNYLFNIWMELYKLSDDNLKDYMFSWFKTNADKLEVFEEVIDEILFKQFNEKRFLKSKLALTEEKFIEYKNSKNGWSDEYNAGLWGVYHIKMMNKMKVSFDKIEVFCKENKNYSGILKYYINACIQREEYEKAISLLIEGKRQFQDLIGIVVDLSLKLKNLYKKIGYTDNYLQELFLLVTKYDSGNMKLYRELKMQYSPDDWINEREKVINELTSKASLQKVYAEEHLYDQLLSSVLNERGLIGVKTYQKLLKPLYPNQLLKKYNDVLQEMATESGDRRHYQDLVKILRQMKKYPDGNVIVGNIIDQWKVKYSRRPAMLDELSRL